MNEATVLKNAIENEDFDFDKLKEEVVAGLKAGRPFFLFNFLRAVTSRAKLYEPSRYN
jgi:hypothetical protein